MSTLVSVGLITRNSEADLPQCLSGVKSQTYSELELLVVDNNSYDRSIEIVEQRCPDARMLANSVNEGYGKAHNMAIRASRGRYYLALNPDVQMRAGYIESLVAALENDTQYGSAAGKLLQAEHERASVLDSAGLFIDRRRHQYLRGYGQQDQAQYDSAEEVFGADGAAPLYRRQMLEDVKIMGEYFDESYFLYMEDVDLAWRSRLLGWRCWYEPQAVATHRRTFRPGERRPLPRALRRIAVRNRHLTIIKNEAPECFRRDWARILFYELGILAYITLMEQTSIGAYKMLQEQWADARARREQIWDRVRAGPEKRLGWFN